MKELIYFSFWIPEAYLPRKISWKQTINPQKHHYVLQHYLRTSKSLHHKPSHQELTKTGLDYSLTKRKCAKMRTKTSVLTRFNFAKYEARSKKRERASNLRSLSFAIERKRVTPASWVSIYKAGGGRGVAGGTKYVKNTSSSMQIFPLPMLLSVLRRL